MANKRISQLTNTITAFRTGDVIPVDGPSGTAKMLATDLMKEAAENSVDGGVAASRVNANNIELSDMGKANKIVSLAFDFGEWELGAISSSCADVASTSRIRTALIAIQGDASVHLFVNIPSGYYLIMACTNTSYSTSWINGDNQEFVLPRYTSVRFALKKSDESDLSLEIPNLVFAKSGVNCVGDDVKDLSDVLQVSESAKTIAEQNQSSKADKYVYKVFDFGTWELGAINSSGGDVASNNRIRTQLMAVEGDVSKHLFVNIPSGYYMIMACTNTTYTTSWLTGDNVEFVMPRYTSVRFAVKKSDESNLTYDTPDNIFNDSGITCVGDRKYNLSDVVDYIKMNPLNVSGKNRYYYKFGGKGNDWCFVFTPEGYDPSREKPYPFVICNHGNGYVYDGTPLNTFYTKKTMYLSSSDPNYNSDMTATEDSSLWYSNPTVEALLAEGYVVCGCENYGDNLYGNNDCRNACVDFFEHIVKSYNVTDYCYMIGCSNGAQTTLNASYLLQGKVRAIAILFPLCCLVNQYFSYSAHQAAIRLAYGITDDDIDEAGLVKATATHDFLHTSTSGNVRLDVFPAACVFYSLGDTTTLANQNAIPFIDRLENSTKVVEYHECTGNHGDVSHFQPSVVVDFFGSN